MPPIRGLGWLRFVGTDGSGTAASIVVSCSRGHPWVGQSKCAAIMKSRPHRSGGGNLYRSEVSSERVAAANHSSDGGIAIIILLISHVSKP